MKDCESNKFKVLKKPPREAVTKAGLPETRWPAGGPADPGAPAAEPAPSPRRGGPSGTIKDLSNVILPLHVKLRMFILVF